MSDERLSPTELAAALKHEALRLGFDLAGAAPAGSPRRLDALHQWLAAGRGGDMSYFPRRLAAYADPRSILPSARSLLMLAAGYRTVEPAEPAPGMGRVARYAWGEDYHDVLRGRMRALAEFHRRLTPQAQVRGVVDTAPLLERDFAQQAGLGWIGKNTALVHDRLGSWLFLAALLTSAELAYDEPAVESRCGTCMACIEACPTGALVAPYQLDARRCVSYLTIEHRGPIPGEFHAAIGDRVFGCDRCQEVCPWNRQASAPADAAAGPFAPRAGLNPLPLAELAGLDEAAWQAQFGGTALARTGRDGLLRNAAIVQANQGQK